MPKRKCIACGISVDKRGLIRMVKNTEGNIVLDPYGRLPGRGAYLCKSKACFGNLRKKRGLERAFKTGISAEVYDAMEEILQRIINESE